MNVTNSWSIKNTWKKVSSFLYFLCSIPELWSLNCPKKCILCNFVLTSAKKPKSIKAIYICTSERSRYALSENDIVYYVMIYCFGDIRVWSRRILFNFCWISNFFDILIANISWTLAQNPINHIIFWNSVMKTFRCIYVNCFNRLGFLSEVSTKFQNIHFFGQIKDHTSGRKHRN